MKLVALCFKGTAFIWWGQTTMNPKFQKAPARTWDKMNRLLREYFFINISTYRQGTCLVSNYSREFHQLTSRTKLQESEEQLVMRFIGELKEKLKDKLILDPQYSLINAINIAEHLERQSNRYSTFTAGSTSQPNDNQDGDRGILPTPKGKEPMHDENVKPAKPSAADPNLLHIKCYRGQEFGLSPTPARSNVKHASVRAELNQERIM